MGAPQSAVKSKVAEAEETEDPGSVEIGEAEMNELWAGESDGGDIDPDAAEALLDWLEEHEPDIHAAIVGIAQAAGEGDEMAMAAAQKALSTAEQYLSPEYPPLSPEQRSAMGSAIAEASGMAEVGTPEWTVGVAGAIASARGAPPAEEEAGETEQALGVKKPGLVKKPMGKPPMGKPPMAAKRPPMVAKRPPIPKPAAKVAPAAPKPAVGAPKMFGGAAKPKF